MTKGEKVYTTKLNVVLDRTLFSACGKMALAGQPDWWKRIRCGSNSSNWLKKSTIFAPRLSPPKKVE
jgi:hypothetical protein